jgi:hypothetical protein
MTNSPAPFSDDDLSADLDDEAGIDVRARILEDPQASARRTELAEAARWLADSPVARLPDEQVDALVANALEVSAAPALPRRAGRSGAPWLVAAAVIVLVGIGLSLIWTGREDSTETSANASTTATATDQESSAEDAADQDPTTDVGREASAAEPGAIAATPFLGTFDDADALRAALADSSPAEVTADTSIDAPSTSALARCEQQLQITLELEGPPLATGYASVGGQLVLVYEWDHESFTDGRPTTLVTAVGSDACDQVALFER